MDCDVQLKQDDALAEALLFMVKLVHLLVAASFSMIPQYQSEIQQVSQIETNL